MRQALADVGLEGAVKTSGAKGVHVFVPIDDDASPEDAAAATRGDRRAGRAPRSRRSPRPRSSRRTADGKVFVDATRVGGATVVAAYSPRVRPGVPVSFPVAWDDLDDVAPADFTVHTALEQLGGRDPWAAQMPAPQRLRAELIEEGHASRSPRAGHARRQRRGRERRG